MELKPEHVDFCAELEFVHVLAGLKGVAGELEKGEGGPMRLEPNANRIGLPHSLPYPRRS